MRRIELAIALLGLGLACTQGARAGEVRFDGVLPNGTPYATHVVSMQDERYTNMVRQHTDYSCGAAALATILRYAYHLDVDETTVIQGMLGVSNPTIVRQRGFSLLDIKHYVELLGMRVNGFTHFVVLKQVHNETAELADPILGNRSVPLADFMKSWPSQVVFVVIGSDFDRNTVLLQPVIKPSARALFARQGPITNAELLDFGFTNADLF